MADVIEHNYDKWVRDKQRVLVQDEQGHEIGRGTVNAYLPASLVLTMEDGGQYGYPVTRVRPLSPDDPFGAVTTALIAAGAATTAAGADLVESGLKAAGYQLVRRTRPPGPGGGTAPLNPGTT